MSKNIFFHKRNIQEISLESRPEEELGFDYDSHDEYVNLGDGFLTDVGLVNIDLLIENLTEMKSNGVTHVSCDWHSDHQELDLYGVQYRLANQEEIDAYKEALTVKENARKQREIEKLEAKLKQLKGA